MISETLVEELETYRIGPKLRDLRKEKGLSLAELGAHSGLSPGMLSKIERGALFPTLPTLMRIALVFGVGLEHFFVEDEARPALAVIRAADRLRLPDRAGKARPAYWFESLDFRATERPMEAYLATFPPDGPDSDSHDHGGAELVYVIDGALAVTVEGRRVELAQGDALYFDSDRPHVYAAAGPAGATAIVVVAG